MAMNHYTDMFLEFQKYMEEGVLSDITIKVRGREFPLHRVVLAAASDYFKAMFTVEMKEKAEKQVEIVGVAVPAFQDCIRYIYFGDLKFEHSGGCEIQTEKFSELLHAGELFQLLEVKNKCVEKIKTVIDENNCVQLYQVSMRYNCMEIEDIATVKIMSNAETILNSSTILSSMKLDTIEMMLKSEYLNISDESVVFQGLMKWIGANEKERSDHLCDLLPLVRLPVINKKYLAGTVHTNPHLNRKCAECKSYLDKTMRHLVGGENHGLKEYQMVSRLKEKTTKKVFVVHVNCKNMQIFNPDSSTLHDLEPTFQPPDIETDCFATVYHNQRLYVLGENKGRRSFYCEIRKDRTWHELPPLPQDHNDEYYRSRVICFGDKILVIGGEINKAGVNVVDCFDTPQNKWINFPSLLKGRCNHTVVVANQLLFVIGGWNKNNLSSVESYNFDADKWTNMPSLNIARQCAMSAYYKGKVYVAGGSLDISSVETISPGDDAWTYIASMNAWRYFGSMFVVNDKLYVFGGKRKNDQSLFECFNYAEQKWESSDMKNDGIELCNVLLCDVPFK